MYDLMDDIENPLEPMKVKSALLSEYQKMEYRNTHRPKDINILDYTVIAALEKQMPKNQITRETGMLTENWYTTHGFALVVENTMRSIMMIMITVRIAGNIFCGR